MAADYLPRAQTELIAWLKNFQAALDELGPQPGITAAELGTFASDVAGWLADYQAHLVAQDAVRVARQKKDEGQKALFARGRGGGTVRSLVARLQADPAMTDVNRARLGIPIRDRVRTTGGGAAAVAAAYPIGKIDTSNRLQHVLAYRDAGNQKKRAKPKGVRGCEIWLKVGDGAGRGGPGELAGNGEPADMRFLGLATATPYSVHFAQADAGKTAYYVLRWVANDGTKGSWSETVEATIVG